MLGALKRKGREAAAGLGNVPYHFLGRGGEGEKLGTFLSNATPRKKKG